MVRVEVLRTALDVISTATVPTRCCPCTRRNRFAYTGFPFASTIRAALNFRSRPGTEAWCGSSFEPLAVGFADTFANETACLEPSFGNLAGVFGSGLLFLFFANAALDIGGSAAMSSNGETSVVGTAGGRHAGSRHTIGSAGISGTFFVGTTLSC